MRRVLLASVVLCSAGAATAPVLAAAPADAGDAATISVHTPLPDGDTLALEIRPAQLSDGPRLVVETTRCDDDGACIGDSYTGALDAAAFTVDRDAGTARLSTTLDGRALTITWAPPQNGGYEFGSGTVGGSAHGIHAGNFAGESADATVQYGGQHCAGVGGVGTAIYANDGTDRPAPEGSLAELHLPDGIDLHC